MDEEPEPWLWEAVWLAGNAVGFLVLIWLLVEA